MIKEQCHVRLVEESWSLEQQLGGVGEEQCHVRLVEELSGVQVVECYENQPLSGWVSYSEFFQFLSSSSNCSHLFVNLSLLFLSLLQQE